jgi:hypothetical protein
MNMNDENPEQIERRVAAAGVLRSPHDLRGKVLADVQHELRASRWDRRLARVAAGLLIVGVGINVVLAASSHRHGDRTANQIAKSHVRKSLIDAAVDVAAVSDAATARKYARRLAEMTGGALKPAESAAIDTAIEHRSSRTAPGGNG